MGASGKEIFAPETRDADMQTPTWSPPFPPPPPPPVLYLPAYVRRTSMSMPISPHPNT
jgi:hypothetical protein